MRKHGNRAVLMIAAFLLLSGIVLLSRHEGLTGRATSGFDISESTDSGIVQAPTSARPGSQIDVQITTPAPPTETPIIEPTSDTSVQVSRQSTTPTPEVQATRFLTDTVMAANQTSVFENKPISIAVTYRIGTGGAPTLPWIILLNNTKTMKIINSSCYSGSPFQVLSANVTSCTTCTYNSDGTITFAATTSQNKDMPMTWFLQACSGSSSLSPVNVSTGKFSGDGDTTFGISTGNIVINAGFGGSAPANQTVELGNETTLLWTLSGSGGSYYVTRNGTLFQGPSIWNGTTNVYVTPNSYFLGLWNYTLYFNDTIGNNGSSATTLNVVDTIFPSCNDPAAVGNGTGSPSTATITINGNMDDWLSLLSNPSNAITDRTLMQNDPDVPPTADRDIIKVAYTYDSQYMYFYFDRYATGNNQVSMLVYVDKDIDGYMGSSDKVLKFTWSGSNGWYDGTIHDYFAVLHN
jgi:hypothetical protein